MSERKKLAIIDGKSIFYRGYYAMGSLSMSDGTPTGGVYGFAAMSLELIKKLQPDYVCVAWDKAKTNIRRRLAIHPEYKAGRKSAPEDFYKQMPLLFELLDAFSWPLYEFDDYEADDIMHTLARKADTEGLETMLITSDLDSLQSVSEHTHVYALKKGFSNIERFDIEAFEKKYGIKTEQFLDLKSLKGDSSDNIPGVPGVGEKTAADLLNKYHSLAGIYENIALIKPAVAKKLEAGRESAYMSKEVARLFDDAPVELDLNAMDVADLDTKALKSLLQKLEFKSLLRSLPETMQDTETENDLLTSNGKENLKVGVVNVINNKSQVDLLKQFEHKKDVVVYCRTADALGKKPQVIIVADDEQVVVVDCLALGKDLPDILQKIAPYSITGYDLKHFIKLLLQFKVQIPVISHDILVGGFLINSLQRESSLTEMFDKNLGIETELDNIPPEDIIQKAGVIVAGLRRLAFLQSEQMSELTGLIKVAEDIEWPIIPVLAKMEVEGIELNAKALHHMSEEFTEIIDDIIVQIYGHADQEFNISSPSQLAKVLFEDLQLPTKGIKRGKTGYSTDAKQLEKLRWSHPIINLVTQYREYTKLKSTYIDALPKLVDERSRLHTDFRLTVAQTGRLSSAEPNLQNIPVRTEIGKKIREAFVAGEGRVFVSADYSQFELRLAAAMADDKELVELFNQDADIHTETAAKVYDVSPHEVTPDQRRHAKVINFGILYGMSGHGLSVATGTTELEAKEFLAKYKELRRPIFDYTAGLIEQAKKKGFVETLFGRRRPMPDINSSNFIVRSGAERAAMNMPIQGTEADLMKMAMIEVDRKLPKGAKQLLQIHDSIIVECLESQVQQIEDILKETMENIYTKLPVKLKVDVKSGKTWGAL
jgi:DNA polymerase-1